MTTTPSGPSEEQLQSSGDSDAVGEIADEGYGAGVEDPATGLVDRDDMNIEAEDPTLGSNDDLDEGHGVASNR
jgi:hypothetical protein